MRWPCRAAEFLIVALFAQACATVGTRTATLRFPSLADGTMIDGYLFRPDGEARHPAVVLLHGCGGLFSPTTGQMSTREHDWAQRFVAMGYSALLVDSFSPRGIVRMCSPESFRQSVFLERPKDAYGALRYLQAQPFVRPDRIAIVGWSQGGGVTLLSVRTDSLGRPQDLARGDFRAAVAFYPSVCNARSHRLPWTSTIPMLVLVGEHDNWTPAAPCSQFVAAAAARGSDIRIHVYGGAYHDFDWPNMPVQSLPAYRTSRGVVPIVGMDPAARDDALIRVTQFLKARLEDQRPHNAR
jgi:dienelactone hydrolase